MRYASINKNDAINGEGVCVSVWFQGCPHHCSGCHNPEQWDPNGGIEISKEELLNKIKSAITANGIIRNVSFLGGEPLAPYNVNNAIFLAKGIKEAFPNIKLFIWTGYTFENFTEEQKQTIPFTDVYIDGLYIESLRDITLHLRGSSNQRVIRITKD